MRRSAGVALVTGGAGFIGSHVTDRLVHGNDYEEVKVVDDLSSGILENLGSLSGNPKISFERCDLTEGGFTLPEGCEVVYHLAANPDVRAGSDNPRIHFRQNILATFNLLEAVRNSRTVQTIVFTSTSTVYGEATKIPTPEDYGPMIPISVYGASKLSAESLISAYASSYGVRAIIFRLANVIGARSNHGIIPDFMKKLRSNPAELEILGDGTQNKSYVHIDDCVEGLLLPNLLSQKTPKVEIYNLGSEDQIDVVKIADIVCAEAGLERVRYRYSPQTADGRGWAGDVKVMKLDVSKLKRAGWKIRMNSEQAVRATARELLSPFFRPGGSMAAP